MIGRAGWPSTITVVGTIKRRARNRSAMRSSARLMQATVTDRSPADDHFTVTFIVRTSLPSMSTCNVYFPLTKPPGFTM